MTPQLQQQPSGRQRLGTLVQGINELNWFNHILDFVFKLTAFASEGLLALGVILSTANHFQHGALFSTVVPLAHGKSELVDTPIFQAWTWTQAVGFEASAGVVLTRAIAANQDNDKLKRNILFGLTIGLAVVGTVMLVMALVEASTGIQESRLPAWYGVFMAVLRGIVSVAYVTIGRVKNLRFSGNPVMQPVEVPDVMARLEELQSRFQGVQAQSRTMIEGVHLSVNQVSEQLLAVQSNTPALVQAQSHRIIAEMQQVVQLQLTQAVQSQVQGIHSLVQTLCSELPVLVQQQVEQVVREVVQAQSQVTVSEVQGVVQMAVPELVQPHLQQVVQILPEMVQTLVLEQVQPLLQQQAQTVVQLLENENNAEALQALAEQLQQVSSSVSEMRTTITEVRTITGRKAWSEPVEGGSRRGTRGGSNEPLQLVHSQSKGVDSEPSGELASEPVGERVKRFISDERSKGREPSLSEIMNQCGCSKNTAIKYRDESMMMLASKVDSATSDALQPQ